MAPNPTDPAVTRPDTETATVKDLDHAEKPKDLEAVMSSEVGHTEEYTEEQYKKVTRKIDRYLMPMMFFIYGIQQTDKTFISIQALFGMETDLGLHGQQYQWLTTIFYLTFLFGEFPSTWLMQKFQIGRVLSIYVICWSICILCISAVQNWSQFMALRALQGLFESNVSPGFLLLTGEWYRTEEHAHRSLWWQASEGLFSVVCNLMLYGLARHVTANNPHIAAWRTISLFLGSLTFVGGIACFWILGSPHQVPWLNEEEKKIAATRVLDNQIGEESTSRKWRWDQVRESFTDPQVYFIVLNTFLSCIPNGGITTFSSLMYQTFGFNNWDSMLYGTPRNGIYVVCFVACAYYLRYFQDQRLYIMIVSCILPMVGMLVMSLLPNTEEYKWVKWGMYIITVVFSLAVFLGWSLITSNIAGGTKRTVVSSLTLIAYCVGNMVGSQVFRTSDAPRYVRGTVACTICFGLEVLCIIAWRLWYMRENRRRERLAAESGLSKEEQMRIGLQLGEQDTTDLANPHFRYAM